jgi:hypothetical protein
MIGGVGEGRKRRAAVAWGVKKMVEPAEEENQKRGGRLLLKKDGFRVRFFFVFLLMFPKLSPPLKIQCSMVFIGKVLLGFQISPSTFPFLLFSSFFCKF